MAFQRYGDCCWLVFVGISSGCHAGGSGGSATDAATDAVTPDPNPSRRRSREEDRRDCVWCRRRPSPPAEDHRCAMSASRRRRRSSQALGRREKLFKEWEGEKGEKAKQMKERAEVREEMLVRVLGLPGHHQVGEDETFGPIGYTVVSATDRETTVKFARARQRAGDPLVRLGQPVEGGRHIKAEDAAFDPLNVSKKCDQRSAGPVPSSSLTSSAIRRPSGAQS